MRTRQQPIDELLVRLADRGRARTPPPPRPTAASPVRSSDTRRISVARSASGDGFKFLLGEPRQDECVDRHSRGRVLPSERQLRFSRRNERPVRRVLRPLLDPRLDLLLLRLGQFRVRVRRRHDLLLILARDAQPDLAVRRVARLDPNQTVALGVRRLRHIEPQLSLARLLVEPVTRETVLRQDRPDVAIVVELRCRPERSRARR